MSLRLRHVSMFAALALPSLCLLAAATQPVPVRSNQPDTVRTQPQLPDRRPIDGPKYAAWIPPGTYTAIVLNSSGDQRRWAVSLMTTRLNVPIVVAPGDNVIIPFKDGWKVDAKDEARLVSNLVPFDDSAMYNKVGEQPVYVVSAWGITPTGPVPFVYKQIIPTPANAP